MNKEQYISKINRALPENPRLLYVYLGGSFNTPFFRETSDLDLVMIWETRPSINERMDVLSSLQFHFQCREEWSFLDANDSVNRDALKLQSLRKIEVYHHDFHSFEDILERQQDLLGLSFSLEHRLPLIDSPEMELFINSFSTNVVSKRQDLYFDIMSSTQRNESAEKVVEMIYGLFSLFYYKGVPSQKHWDKLSEQILQSHLLREGRVSEWIESCKSELLEWSGTMPEVTIVDIEGLKLAKYSSEMNLQVFSLVQGQIKRLQEFLSWPRHLNSFEDQILFSERATQQWGQGSAFHFQIFLEGMVVGAISIHSLNFADRSFEFGYWVDQAHEGKGLITKSLYSLMRHMRLRGWEMAKISALEHNQRSSQVAERLGMAIFERNGKFTKWSASLIDIPKRNENF